MRWLKLTVAYDGRAYAGWQIQPHEPTVQSVLETAWQEITGEAARLTVAGRTDAGVHALGQVAGVATSTHLDQEDLRRGLNAKLPDDVAVLRIEKAPAGFHATRDAIGKLYRYQIHNSRTPSVFGRHYAWHCPQPLHDQNMHQGSQLLLGRHDFSSFETSGSCRADKVRTISHIAVQRGAGEQREQITIEVAADGFLYNMVRTIVGTLVHVGRGRRPPQWVGAVLRARNRSRAGQTAPAHGLFLVGVSYEKPWDAAERS